MSSHDPSLSSALALTMEKAVNTALKFDPGTRHQLTKIADKTLAIKCAQPDITLFISANAEQISISAHNELASTTELSGNLFKLLALLFRPASSLADSGVRVEGQVSLLASYQQLIKNLDIDWQDAASSLIGELPAHQLANVVGKAKNWAGARARPLPTFFSEFLTEELRAVPHRAELENFADDVEQLRQKTDRLNALLRTLEQ